MNALHSYSIDSDKRTRGKVWIAFISAAVISAASALPAGWWPTYISIPTAGALFWGLFWIADTWAWKWKWVQEFGLVKIPNLNGTWTGHIKSQYEGADGPKVASLKITQSWTKIGICLKTEHSESASYVASLATEVVEGKVLTYIFRNRVLESTAISTMSDHSGTAWLTVCKDSGIESLVGGYYSGRGRGNCGSLEFYRTSKLMVQFT